MTDDAKRRRAMIAFDIVRTIAQRAGAGSVEHVHIAAITAIADTRGLWAFLVAKGLATEAEHQTFLDRGYEDLRKQVDEQASTIYVAEGGRG